MMQIRFTEKEFRVPVPAKGTFTAVCNQMESLGWKKLTREGRLHYVASDLQMVGPLSSLCSWHAQTFLKSQGF